MTPELKAENFFASRSGVCVYVTIKGHTFRVQFASATAQGVVSDPQHPDASAAAGVARAAVGQYEAQLAPLFEKVARGTT